MSDFVEFETSVMYQDPYLDEETFEESPEELKSSEDEGSIAKKNDSLRRKKTMTEIEKIRFQLVNERVVQDVTLEVLYKPHTLSVLVVLCAYVLYKAFCGLDDSTENNILNGLKALGTLFLVMSAMAFPNGPFIRPHPILWRLVFGLSVLYSLILQFTLFQSFTDIKKVLGWLDPVGLSQTSLQEKEYAVNCSNVTWDRIWANMDIFALAHFLGWVMKALLIRHWIICWYISIAWEATEVVFAHLLPNFQECWWDAIFLDIIICNGFGIFIGLLICRMLEMRQFHWESIKNIRTARGKLKRAVLQFTPESWMKVEWLNVIALKRCIAIYLFIIVWLASELNTFFLKHVFSVDTSHPVVFWRVVLIGVISAPSIRQYYLYSTDPRIKRIGMQCWVYLAVCVLEAAICIKFGRSQLPALQLTIVGLWILALAIGTFFCVLLSAKWARYSSITKNVAVQGGEKRHCYLDSSCENLGTIADDVNKLRRRLRLFDVDN